LQARGITDASASLAAEMGIALFKTAFEGWIAGPRDRDFADHIRAVANELSAMASGSGTAATSRRRPPNTSKGRGRRGLGRSG
jgi:hypothetical protein